MKDAYKSKSSQLSRLPGEEQTQIIFDTIQSELGSLVEIPQVDEKQFVVLNKKRLLNLLSEKRYNQIKMAAKDKKADVVHDSQLEESLRDPRKTPGLFSLMTPQEKFYLNKLQPTPDIVAEIQVLEPDKLDGEVLPRLVGELKSEKVAKEVKEVIIYLLQISKYYVIDPLYGYLIDTKNIVFIRYEKNFRIVSITKNLA